MIKIFENPDCWTVSEKFWMPDAKGRRGIDYFEKKGVVLTNKRGEPADFGLCKNGDGAPGIPRNRCLLLTFEPPGNIENLEDPRVRGLFKNYLSCCVPPDDPHHFSFARSFNLVEQLFNIERKNLVCMMSRNRNTIKGHEREDLYEYRRQLVAAWTQLLTPEEFHLYGRWDAKYRPHYRGECLFSNGIAGYGLASPVTEGQALTLDARYTKFPEFHYNVATENSRHPGYVTEKIFNAMITGCVPLYLGATQITKMVPQECFINLEGKSFPEQVNLIRGQSQAERDKVREATWKWIHDEGTWWYSSWRMAKQVLWALGIISREEADNRD